MSIPIFPDHVQTEPATAPRPSRTHRPVRLTVEQRLNLHLDRTDTCWIFTGSLSYNGYGHLRVGTTVARAHRVAYELWVGPIPEGHHLDHVEERGCTSRACCNPAHLEPLTQAEHNRRTAARRRARLVQFPQRAPIGAAA